MPAGSACARRPRGARNGNPDQGARPRPAPARDSQYPAVAGEPRVAADQTTRRTFITGLLDQGNDIAVASRMAGHRNISTTTRYDRRDERTNRDAAATIHIPYQAPQDAPPPVQYGSCCSGHSEASSAAIATPAVKSLTKRSCSRVRSHPAGMKRAVRRPGPVRRWVHRCASRAAVPRTGGNRRGRGRPRRGVPSPRPPES